MLKDMWSVFTDRTDFFLELLLEHLEISLVSILTAILLGGFAGILISEFQKAVKPTLGVINFLYTIPSISMLGFLIPFSGVGNATAIIALTVYALLPMVRNTHTGITNVDSAVLEAAKGMGSTKAQILFKPDDCAQSFVFPGVNARYIRIRGTSLRQNPSDNSYYRMQFVEAEVYPANIAVNGAAVCTSTSSLEYNNWGVSKVTDGQRNSLEGTFGWSSDGNTAENHTESITVDLGALYNIGTVNLYPRNNGVHIGQGFPIDFTIKVSADNAEWTAVAVRSGYPQPSNEVQSFRFAGINARYIKIEGTSLRQNPYDGNLYRMQLAEVMVYSSDLCYGDLNCDGIADIKDLIVIKKAVSGGNYGSSEPNVFGDLNCDGEISASDLVAMRKYLLGIA